MATRSEEFFHDKWLGMVQTESDGLVVAKPVLLAAGCANRQPPAVQEKLRELCPEGPEDAQRRIADLMQFFIELLDFDADLFDEACKIPGDVSLYAPEGPQTIRPTLGLLRQDEPEPQEGPGSPASNAADKYVALLWDVTEIDGEHDPDVIGLRLDKPETTTGEWSYPAAAKFDRLLRHCRVPVGILTNREVIRLVYAPHGESSGHITFRVDDMATVGGRPILDAMIMLLCANQWFGVSDENSLPSLLQRSREYQGTVTEDLAEQVFSGLEQLLKGFQRAAERDRSVLLRQALGRDEDHLYRGLLTVMLRLVFILYAEDRGLLPVDHPLYAKRMSLLGLFERLQRDHGNFPDSMDNRFGAWGHIISLSRAIYLGVEHGDFHIPPRQGDLFDPHRYPFLEGWYGGSAPIVTQTARAEVKVPTVDDGTVFALLQSLLIFQGQRLSYRTLDVEQIGSVYEALMGYQVSPCESPAVAIKISGKRGAAKYWLEPESVLARPVGQRVKWLKDECGFDKAVATRIKKALDGVEESQAGDSARIEALLALAAGKKGLAPEQRAEIGQYVLQPGAERRRSGTQYTPRSLTQPVVRKALEPLIRCLGEEPIADQLLELRICDPAMGSGAFLVECCRQLADEVVAAWGRAKDVERIAANSPESDVVAHARRLVAQRCLYGVDKNEMAVQLSKLSLWLFTLARDLPFTFLDHSFRRGDALVGFNLEQIKAFHWKPEKQLSFIEIETKRALNEVVAIRQEIHRLAADQTPQGQKEKAQRLFDANDATERVRCIADVCVGAFFAAATDKARLAERQARQEQVHAWLGGSAEAGESVEEWVSEARDRLAPFHWWLEFPEVFYDARPDPLAARETDGAAYMEAFIGNPPFVESRKLAAQHGESYTHWLVLAFAPAHGNANYCAFFFRRAFSLLGTHGTLGMLATKSISEAHSRTTSLAVMLSAGARIYDAQVSRLWPGQASVRYSSVCAALGAASRLPRLPVMIDNRSVPSINSFLEARKEYETPGRLAANTGLSFIGNKIYGQGFIVSWEEAEELIAKDARNEQLIQPYLIGEDLNGATGAACRAVINFGDRSLEDARDWPDLLRIVEERVRPDRESKGDHPLARFGKKYWWQFGSRVDDLYEAICELDRCLVTARSPKHFCFDLQSTQQVFSESLHVFALETYTAFAILQSRVHIVWALLHGRKTGTAGTPSYAAKRCFDTFPFPERDPRAALPLVEAAGRAVCEARKAVMAETGQGLTKTYNALKDPDCENRRILELRQLHEELDRAVVDAYEWSGIEVPPYCPTDEEGESAFDSFTDGVIDRLHVLNAERTMETESQEPTATSRKKRTAPAPKAGATMTLPGMHETDALN